MKSSAPTVTIIVGLPGCGKTKYLNAQFSDLPQDRLFDDFHRDSLDGTGRFESSKHIKKLRNKLEEGLDCVISDIEYCRPHRLTAAKEGIARIFRDLGVNTEIAVLCFENRPDICAENARHRFEVEGNRDIQEELSKIQELTTVYRCVSVGAIPVRLWSDDEDERNPN